MTNRFIHPDIKTAMINDYCENPNQTLSDLSKKYGICKVTASSTISKYLETIKKAKETLKKFGGNK